MSCGGLGPTGFIRQSHNGLVQPELMHEVPVPTEEKEISLMVLFTMPPSLPIGKIFMLYTSYACYNLVKWFTNWSRV